MSYKIVENITYFTFYIKYYSIIIQYVTYNLLTFSFIFSVLARGEVNPKILPHKYATGWDDGQTSSIYYIRTAFLFVYMLIVNKILYFRGQLSGEWYYEHPKRQLQLLTSTQYACVLRWVTHALYPSLTTSLSLLR